MVKPRKLPSGKWNVRVKIGTGEKGAVYRSFTAETEAEARRLAEKFEKATKKARADLSRVTVRDCMERYLEKRRNISPTTKSNYRKIIDGGAAFRHFLDMPIMAIDERIAQRYVDIESERKGPHGAKISPKTVKNEWALITSSVRHITGVEWPDIELPKAVKKLKMYPDPENVLELVVGSSVELPALLALWLSFSMSEIKGLRCSSVRQGYICIDQVMVYAGGVEVIKDAGKAYNRNRAHRLPEYLERLIRQTEAWKAFEQTGEDGFLITESRDAIYRRYKRIMERAGLDLSFHDLRHLSASIGLNELQIAPKVMQERGGWASDSVMKTVYSHSFPRLREESDRRFDEYFSEALEALNKKHGTAHGTDPTKA